MGPGQYRSGCRNAGPNPNRFADSCVKRYSVWADHTNAYAYSYSDANCNGYTYDYSYTDFNSTANSNSQRYSATKGSPDSASPAVSA